MGKLSNSLGQLLEDDAVNDDNTVISNVNPIRTEVTLNENSGANCSNPTSQQNIAVIVLQDDASSTVDGLIPSSDTEALNDHVGLEIKIRPRSSQTNRPKSVASGPSTNINDVHEMPKRRVQNGQPRPRPSSAHFPESNNGVVIQGFSPPKLKQLSQLQHQFYGASRTNSSNSITSLDTATRNNSLAVKLGSGDHFQRPISNPDGSLSKLSADADPNRNGFIPATLVLELLAQGGHIETLRSGTITPRDSTFTPSRHTSIRDHSSQRRRSSIRQSQLSRLAGSDFDQERRSSVSSTSGPATMRANKNVRRDSFASPFPADQSRADSNFLNDKLDTYVNDKVEAFMKNSGVPSERSLESLMEDGDPFHEKGVKWRQMWEGVKRLFHKRHSHH
ncbi:hypothetical protein HDU76_003691 [Blyttiomyces sp. JEL0837]|nr:hypothetical protein HDU76_003691 [Blyttiomyces sp. JEL0837]